MVDLALAASFIGGAIISIIVISNPLSTSAIFIALTEEMKHSEKLEIAKRSVRYSTGILIFFALTGMLLFQVFGISIGAFRIAGGILLFTMAVHMLNPKGREKEAEEAAADMALIPLSIPFTAGPGTITTVVVLISEAVNLVDSEGILTASLAATGVFIGIAVTVGVSYLMMMNSDRVDERLGTGRRVVTRLMGLIVMAIAIQFIINGIKDVLPEFIDIAEGTAETLRALITR
jgi:multiple antibiotic resistance protein